MAVKDDVGRAGEVLAGQWLQDQGWVILATNWRCRHGEIDIIGTREQELVFFEVKTRRSVRFGYPTEAVSAAKIARMRRLAGIWLTENPGQRGRIRLDVIGILTTGDKPLEIDHVEAVG